MNAEGLQIGFRRMLCSGMKRAAIVVMAVMGVCSLSAQTYDKMWEKVEQFEQRKLPKSAYAEIQRIREKAVREKHIGQETAALLGGYLLQQEVVPDSFFSSVADLEYRRRTSDAPVQKAVYAAVLGQLYANNRYRSQAPALELAAPSDSLREWSSEQYDSAAVANCRLALQHPQALLEARAKTYMPFVVQGKDAGYFHGDLLNVVGRQTLQTLQALEREKTVQSLTDEVFAKMLATYRAAGNREAELLITLDSVEAHVPVVRNTYYKRYAYYSEPKQKDKDVLDGEAYRTYRRLLEQFSGSPLVAEVYVYMLKLDISPAYKVEWAKEALQKYPSYHRSAYFENVLTDLQQPTFQWQREGLYYPERFTDWVVTARNITHLDVEVYKTNATFDKDQMLRMRQPENYVRKTGAKIDHFVHAFKKRPAYEEFTDTLHWFAPEVGRYAVIMKPIAGMKTQSATRSACNVILVSRMKVMTQARPDGQLMCAVTDAREGTPLADVEVTAYREWNGHKTLFREARTDGRGQLLLPANREKGSYIITARRGEDVYLPESTAYEQAVMAEEDNSRRTNTSLYTDRHIYRPGQQIQVSGITYIQEGRSQRVAEGEELTLECWNANGKKLEEKIVKTDEYGVFSESFRLPERAALGYYSIRTSGASVGVRVEEYKRPTFKVEFDTVKERYAAGDTVTVTGEVRTFAGAPCRNARLTGTGHWQFPLWRMQGRSAEEVRLDTIYTDENGRFVWRVPLSIDKEMARMGCNLHVSAEVLNATGETQPGEFSLPLGRAPLQLSGMVDEKLDRERLQPWKFRLTTLNGSLVDSTVHYVLMPDTMIAKANPTYVLDAQVKANTSFLPEGLRALPSGKYKLCASVIAGRDTISWSQSLVLFGMEDVHPAPDTDFWYYCPKDTFDAEHPAQLQVGSSFKDVHLYYTVFSGVHMVDSGLVQFSDSLLTFTYPYKEEYGDGLSVLYAFVKNDKVYQRQVTLKRRVPDTRLRLSWATFRDKLQPGAQEEWRLRILSPDGKPAQANLMAAMYDATLDQLAGSAHTWYLSIPVYRHLPYQYWRAQEIPRAYSSLYFNVKRKTLKSWSFDCFDERFLNGMYFYSGGSRAKYYAMGVAENCMSVDEVCLADVAVAPKMRMSAAQKEMSAEALQGKIAGLEMNEAVEEDGDSEAGRLEPVASLRSNFNETAFFYPRMRTDENGEVSLVFTLPESLTTWNFIGLSHTKDMNVGTLQATAMAQKEFMVQLHVPRFVRAGDRVTVTATLNNLTNRKLKGKVRLEVFEPMTEKLVHTAKQNFETDGAAVLSFTLKVDGSYDLLACRVVAESGDYSDGEQYYLPVLSDKEWVTQSVDFSLNEKGEHTVDISALFGDKPKAERRSLTVEYTTNPMWNAVQALPALDNPDTEDALSLAAAYYGASIAAHIAQSTPLMQKVIEAWKAQDGTAETLWSNLQKDETLKGIVLSETPWVLQAENEAANRRNLVALFDVNQQAGRKAALLERLKAVQQADGSLAWFPGMRGSEYITREVAELLVRIRVLTGNKALDADAARVLRSAMNFLKKENAERVTEMRKAEKQGVKITFPGEDALHYLYIVLQSGEKLTPKEQADVQYLMNRLAKANAEVDHEQRALAAIVLNLSGKKETASQFVASLKEHLSQSKSRGTYFEYPGGSFTSIDRKLSIHVQAMEAIQAVTPADRSTLDGMRRWLLQQKRVQSWSTPVNSANAVYALLHSGHPLVATMKADDVTLFLEKKGKKAEAETDFRIEPETAVAGLGYVKQAFTDLEPTTLPHQLRVNKVSDGESWGSVTARCLMPLEEVKAASTGLSIRREVSTSAPRVGEKMVVRYVITADRDYEYVVLKDSRAACCEPVEGQSGYIYRNGLGCYRMVRDAATEYYIDRLPKGTYVIEASSYVDRPGSYSAGPATLQCVYATEYTSHTGSIRLESVK